MAFLTLGLEYAGGGGGGTAGGRLEEEEVTDLEDHTRPRAFSSSFSSSPYRSL